jgi:hypothetical protein
MNMANEAHERRPGRAGGKIGCRNSSLGSARPSWRVMRGRYSECAAPGSQRKGSLDKAHSFITRGMIRSKSLITKHPLS